MGSACCVPTKDSSQEAHGSNEPTNWLVNRNFSSSASRRWDGKPLPEDPNSLHLYRASFSSSSRGGSRQMSSRFATHQRGLSGSVFSPDASPSGSFRLNSSQIWPLVEPVAFAPSGTSDSSTSSYLTLLSSKEGESLTPESTIQIPRQRTPANENPAPSSRYLSVTAGAGEPSGVDLLGGRMSDTSEEVGPSSSEDSDGLYMASSSSRDKVLKKLSRKLKRLGSGTRERLMQTLHSMDLEDLDLGLREPRSPIQAILYSHIKAAESIWDRMNEVDVRCGLCSKTLSMPPPEQMLEPRFHLEPPTTAILSCDHVFHAQCLEDVTSEESKQCPPCPLCSSDPAALVHDASEETARVAPTE